MEEISEKARQQGLYLFASDLLETINPTLNLPKPSKDEIDGVIKTIDKCTELEGGEEEKGKGFGLHWKPSKNFLTYLNVTPVGDSLAVSVDRIVAREENPVNFSRQIDSVTTVEIGEGVITFKGQKPDEFISVNEFGQVQIEKGGKYS